MGLITPIGNDIKTFWENVHKGKVGIGPIRNFDTSNYKAKLSAEVCDFEPTEYMSPKDAKRMDRFSQFAVAAAKHTRAGFRTRAGTGRFLSYGSLCWFWCWESYGN